MDMRTYLENAARIKGDRVSSVVINPYGESFEMPLEMIRVFLDYERERNQQ